MFNNYFSFPEILKADYKTIHHKDYLFYTIDKLTNDFDETKISQYDIAIIGIPEDRNSCNIGSSEAPDEIRRELYKLYKPFEKLNIIDLGNLKQGKTVKDTYFAVQDIVAELLKLEVLPVIIGGSQDLSYSVFKAYEKLSKTINITTIDSVFDLGNADELFDSKSYMSKILLEKSENYFFLNGTLIYQCY